MSFWQTYGLQTESEIDKLLSPDAEQPPTLQQLLEEEDIIQETKSQNTKLINFLCEGDRLRQLVQYMVRPLSDEELAMETDVDEDEDEVGPQVVASRRRKREQRKYRYPFVCCQIFVSDVSAITDQVFESEPPLVNTLLDVFAQEDALHPLVASYASRLLSYLLSARTTALFEVIRNRDGFVEQLVRHLESSPVLELLTRLTRTEENGLGEDAGEWLKNNNLIPLLLKAMRAPSELAHDCAASLLRDIAQTAAHSSDGGHDGLFMALQGEESVKALYELMLDSSATSSSRQHGITVLQQLSSLSQNSVLRTTEEKDLPSVLGQLIANRERIVGMLKKNEETDVPLDTTFGTLSPPLGLLRMQAIELVRVSVDTKNAAVVTGMFDGGVIDACLDLFFSYVWNNVLHQSVASIIMSVLECPSEHSARLFTDARLHERMADEALNDENKGPQRHGIMGYLTRLAVAIEAEANNVSEIQKALGTSERWGAYVSTDLEESKKRERGPEGGQSTDGELSSDDDLDEDDDEESVRALVQNFHLDFPEDFGLIDFDDHETDEIFDASMYLTAGFNTDEPNFGKEFESESDEEEDEDEEYGSDEYDEDDE